jgi:hypothetical protein
MDRQHLSELEQLLPKISQRVSEYKLEELRLGSEVKQLGSELRLRESELRQWQSEHKLERQR